MSLPLILSHVPVWVWVLLVVLIRMGCLALQDREVPLRRVIMVPVIFMVWGLSGLVSLAGYQVAPYAVWASMAVVLGVIGFVTGPGRIGVDLTRGVAHRPGSVVPLIRNVGLFGVQFALGMGMAMRPDMSGMLILLRSAVSGAMAGYFAGWAAAFFRRYEGAWRLVL
ncbi:hypothetical protein GOB93_13550 [Acetobacter musti]|uniref:DUF1453 domain-containing protein n=1 Tax=Acetobacter musti TaxID=864732 RepID=A0ABX0JQC2_9PROT|nr:DUF6622 family protein [Acetobacter musti]NHN85658.1 hypothetical protein [Acetobacter musti]